VLAVGDRRPAGSEATTTANADAAIHDPGRQDAARVLQQALARSDGTVTAFLEWVTGESVDADVIAQTLVVATARGPLGVEPGQSIIRRQAIIRGRTSRQDYLYAETVLVPDRLPAGVPELLATTNDPIGRVLAARGFGMTRAELGSPRRTPSVARLGSTNSVAAAIFARRYRVDGADAAIMLIHEWFLPDLGTVLIGSARRDVFRRQ
jgi:chorismate-pyruvate lyase